MTTQTYRTTRGPRTAPADITTPAAAPQPQSDTLAPVVCAAAPGDPTRLVRYDVPKMRHVSDEVSRCAAGLAASAAAVADPPQDTLPWGAVLSPATAWELDRAMWQLLSSLPTVWEVERCAFQLQQISALVLQLDTAAAARCASMHYRPSPADVVQDVGRWVTGHPVRADASFESAFTRLIAVGLHQVGVPHLVTQETARQLETLRYVVPWLGRPAWWGLTAGWHLASWSPAGWHPARWNLAAATVTPRSAATDPMGASTARLAAMVTALGMPDRPVRWVRHTSSQGPETRASRSVADLVRTNGDLLPPEGERAADRQGVVRIESVRDTRTGEVALIVHCPGTFDGGDDRNPFDHISNIHLLGYQHSATTDAITQAIIAEKQALGLAEHDSPPVLLSGHSQGGLTAMALAQSSELVRHVTVTHVVAAGAPVDGFTAPQDTAVLAMHHTTDIVPALDGDQVAPASNVTLVVSAGADAPTTDIKAQHRAASYVPVAQTIAADPQLAGFRRGIDRFFTDSEHVQREFSDYQMSRAAQPDATPLP